MSAAGPDDLRFGYAAITWQDKDLDAIREIGEVGFHGIQLRSPILKEFGDKPAALKEILDRQQLTLVALSSGNLRIDPVVEKDDLALHASHARFVKAAGGRYLQIIDTRPKRSLVRDDYTRLGRLLTELGKRSADAGVPLAYHPHMNSIGERPGEVRQVVDASDPRFVKLVFDVAHYQMGGGDPVKGIHEYRDRLLFLHIKDLETPVPGDTGDLSRSYRFVELGRGQVDLKAVFKALADVTFRGWAVVELDKVPDARRTPKESARISKAFLEGLGFSI